jgi:molybdopterin converting factor small subunit
VVPEEDLRSERKGEGRALFKCVIGFIGLPGEIAGAPGVEIELPDEASLSEVVAALRHEIPKLEGRVIRVGQDLLTSYYAFNINGRFYKKDDQIRIRKGDKITLLAIVSGG